LESAIAENEPVDSSKLGQGLARIPLESESQISNLAEILAKSLIEKHLALSYMLILLRDKRPSEAGNIALHVLKIVQSKKGDQTLLTMVNKANAKFDKSSLITLITHPKELNDSQLADFLLEHDLLCLKPVPDITLTIANALQENQSPSQILNLITEQVDEKVKVSYLAETVVSHILPLVVGQSQATDKKGIATPNLDIIDSYLPLLKRIIANDKDTQLKVIYIIQNKTSAGMVRSIFDRVHRIGICSGESFLTWRDDTNLTKDKELQKIKKNTLIKVNSWLTDIETALNKVEEAPKDEEVVPDEEEEEDEYLKKP